MTDDFDKACRDETVSVASTILNKIKDRKTLIKEALKMITKQHNRIEALLNNDTFIRQANFNISDKRDLITTCSHMNPYALAAAIYRLAGLSIIMSNADPKTKDALLEGCIQTWVAELEDVKNDISELAMSTILDETAALPDLIKDKHWRLVH